ncbi:hypothetical protein QVD99_004624 [Batrachochytrium dendrobatidis]|nr:hypothetical protein O5D80_002862 [Batrachochytrium dendrobatidis]KAK5668842.1 hypothetical protein QVD99_004624 [Batrachochytrium dendrobatidis]
MLGFGRQASRRLRLLILFLIGAYGLYHLSFYFNRRTSTTKPFLVGYPIGDNIDMEGDAEFIQGNIFPDHDAQNWQSSIFTANITRYQLPSPSTGLPLKDGSADFVKQMYVREMIRHAWSGYMKYARGTDELDPLTKTGHSWTEPGSMLFTPIDSMSTLFIAGMMKEFNQAKALVIENLDYDKVDTDVNVFETVIRALGGLLSAYDLDGDERILALAVDLADRLECVFQTKTGIPENIANLKERKAKPGYLSLAMVGTNQLEYQYLSDITGNPKYANNALYALEQISSIQTSIKGFAPMEISTYSLTETSQWYAVALETDSYYEYLLKLWLSTGDVRYRKLYDDAASAIEEHLLIKTPTGGAYLTDKRYGVTSDKFHHLSCFAGGMFSTGAVTLANEDADRYFKIASQLTQTCYDSYQISESKLGGEWTRVDADGNLIAHTRSYILRPETVESIFYMWRYTHNPIYREWGWSIVQALESNCKDDVGYHGLDDQGKPHNRQQSFFLAETLKYLYLLFSDDSTIDLSKYVFNTEAHPISVRGYGRRKDPKKWVDIPSPGHFKTHD